MKIEFNNFNELPKQNEYVTFYYIPDCIILTRRLFFDEHYGEEIIYFETIDKNSICPIDQCEWWIYTSKLEDPFDRIVKRGEK